MKNALCILLLSLCAPAPAIAHGSGADHSHDAPDLAAGMPPSTGSPALSGHGTSFDLTVQHAPFHPGERVDLQVFLADWQTNAPVSGANIELTMTGPDSRTTLPLSATDTPGVYAAVIEAAGSDTYSFLADINHNGVFDLISVSGFQADHAETHEADGAAIPAVYGYGPYIGAGAALIAGLTGFFLGTTLRGRRSAPHAAPVPEESK